MTIVAGVNLWGRNIGAVSLAADDRAASFQYDKAFAKSSIQVSPLVMPLAERIYQFPELPTHTFFGLPGLLADSLPDKFGNALIDAWLATQGRSPDSFSPIERLCYTGARGMGALEFVPVPRNAPHAKKARRIEVNNLVELVAEVLNSRKSLHTSFASPKRKRALIDMLRVGTSAGGARAKAVIAWNPATDEVRSGQVPADPGFQHWLLKFDGVKGNKDKELEDPQGYGVIEYAYYLMASDCGIQINQCRLMEENGRRHFMARRFDRTTDGQKLHMQSLGALAHYDFNSVPGSYSYEQAFMAIRQLGLPMAATEEQFRRMAFNIIGRNQDDHVKNIAFLMDKAGQWSLSPAFDMTYAYNPAGNWTARHQMSMNGKQSDFTLDDFRACGKAVLLKRGRAERIVEEVRAVFANWQSYAEQAGVAETWAMQIGDNLRLSGWD
jgi:serine/threonine-protein kinase HipA